MGCVPIAYRSYGSVTDIITDGENGLLVDYGDLQTFYSRMKQMMTNETIWLKMAREAVSSCKRFAIDKVADEWERLLSEQ
jgi:glycosyltransferase involved in cell wall biosynthesis